MQSFHAIDVHPDSEELMGISHPVAFFSSATGGKARDDGGIFFQFATITYSIMRIGVVPGQVCGGKDRSAGRMQYTNSRESERP